MKSFTLHAGFKKIKSYIVAHKIISFIALLVIVGVGYKVIASFTSTAGETRYVLATAQNGTIISSITGSGQVSASNQVDIKAKASGDVVRIAVKTGQDVKAGDVIAELDARDAEIALRNAQITLEKLTRPADELATLQAQNALDASKEGITTSNENLVKAYNDGYNSVVTAFLDMADVVKGLDDLLNPSEGYLNRQRIAFFNKFAQDYREVAYESFNAADKKYEATSDMYKATMRTSATSSIETLINQTLDMTKSLAQAVKDSKAAVDYVQDQESSVSKSNADTAITNITNWTAKTNSELTSLISAVNSIENAKSAIVSAKRTYEERNQSYIDLKNGADALDVETQQLNVQQKLDAYRNAFIRAPFDGVVAKLTVKATDSISSGTSIGTLITKQKIAEVSLNEVDIAKIKVGQKVTLTFDAIPDLTISGEVSEVDLVGTVSQGVVTYAVKISFDTQDERVKTGMSVSAAIITNVIQNVLTVPNSAIKSGNGGAQYVEVFDQKIPTTSAQATSGVTSSVPPRQQTVEVGASNDTLSQIVSGLKEGDQIVSRTITSTAPKASTAPSLFGGGSGARTSAGGAVRNVAR